MDAPIYLFLPTRAAGGSRLSAAAAEGAERVWVGAGRVRVGAGRRCCSDKGTENDSGADQYFGDHPAVICDRHGEPSYGCSAVKATYACANGNARPAPALATIGGSSNKHR